MDERGCEAGMADLTKKYDVPGGGRRQRGVVRRDRLAPDGSV
jgi:hypothetical protein